MRRLIIVDNDWKEKADTLITPYEVNNNILLFQLANSLYYYIE